MTKNKQNVPQVRFKGFTDDWEQREFGNIAHRMSETSLSSDEIPYIEYEDVVANQGVLNKDVATKEGVKTGVVFTEEDVLYGKLRPYLHNWLNPDFNGIAIGDWWVLKPVNADKNFLYRLIQSENFDNVANQSTGTKMPRADWKLVSATEFCIPTSLKEQAEIGKYFTNLDHLITLHQRKCETLQKLKKSMLQKMFPKNGSHFPEIRFKGFTDAWEQREFGNIAHRMSETSLSSDEIPYIEYEDVVANQGVLNKDVATKEGVKTGVVFTEEDVLYGKLRPYLHNWLNPDFNGIAIGDWWVLKPVNADKNFLYRLIQSENFDNVANQSTGTKMPRADWKLVSATEFCIPTSLKEQAEIGKYFTNLDHLITLHQRKLETLKKLKKAMLQKMFI